MAEHKQLKDQILSTQKISDDRKTHNSLQDKLYKKYRKSTTTWPNDMPLEDMEKMVKFRCFSSRPEDAVAMKVIQRFMAETSSKKQVCALQLTLFSSKDCLLTWVFSSSWRLRMQICIKNFPTSHVTQKFQSLSIHQTTQTVMQNSLCIKQNRGY